MCLFGNVWLCFFALAHTHTHIHEMAWWRWRWWRLRIVGGSSSIGSVWRRRCAPFDAIHFCRKMRQFASQSGKRFRRIKQTQFRPNAIRWERRERWAGARRLKCEIIDGAHHKKKRTIAVMGFTEFRCSGCGWSLQHVCKHPLHRLRTVQLPQCLPIQFQSFGKNRHTGCILWRSYASLKRVSEEKYKQM